MKGKSQVVLSKDVGSIGGKSGDVVTVSTGFYMNYLLPNLLALQATEATLEKVAKTVVAEKAAAVAELDEARDICFKLEALGGITILKKVGRRGSIFGSVSELEVVTALEQASGLKLGAPMVTFGPTGPISSVGRYPAWVVLHSMVKAEVTIIVAAAEAAV